MPAVDPNPRAGTSHEMVCASSRSGSPLSSRPTTTNTAMTTMLFSTGAQAGAKNRRRALSSAEPSAIIP